MALAPSVSIGILTLQNRRESLTKLLQNLIAVVQAHDGNIEIVLANNSGQSANADIKACVSASQIANYCPIKIIDSPQNNIATGRNLLLEHSSYVLLAILDDDEYPDPKWLKHLIDIKQRSNAAAVAGPVPAVFHESAPHWVKTVDLHNTRNHKNAEPMDYASTCNVLIDKSSIGSLKFDESYGKSGGSDTDFFLRLRETDAQIYWASDAVVYEDVPAARSTAKYMIHRFIKQGENYRRIRTERGEINSQLMFTVKAAAVVIVALPIACLLVLIRHPQAGNWMKRTFSNYGKLHSPNKQLYDS